MSPARAYNTKPGAGHEWMLDRAIEYLKKKNPGLANSFPLHIYRPWLLYGVWYADHSEVKCKWSYGDTKEYSCDQIHHYGKVADIKAKNPGLPASGLKVAHPGEFAAPEYAEVLVDQAIRFWPGGAKPDLALLPYKKAGSIQAKFLVGGASNLESTYVGGLPLCEQHAHLEHKSSIISIHECPKWPKWAATDAMGKKTAESVETSMKYLGWAIHLVQDLTVADHAENIASDSHQGYEDKVDEWLQDRTATTPSSFDHLPVGPGGSYLYPPCPVCVDFNYPVAPDYFQTNWTAKQFAEQASVVAIQTRNGSAILPSYSSFKSKYGNLVWEKSIAERCVDAAIKLVSALLEDFLLGIALKPDAFEKNDNLQQAKPLSPGFYKNLTIDTPGDSDWYKIRVSQNYSDIAIDLYYDDSAGEVATQVTDRHNPFAGVPHKTSYGKRIVINGAWAGDYFLHVYAFGPLNFVYDLRVSVATGSLPADRFEENDTPNTASEFFDGCDFTNLLNIDRAGDDDYYYIDGAIGFRVEAKISFDPSEGQLDLFLDQDRATTVVQTGPKKRELSIAACRRLARPRVRVTGDRIPYTMCIQNKADPDCTLDLGRDTIDLREITLVPTRPPSLTPSFPSLAGTWKGNNGLTYNITQTGSQFGWTVAALNEKATGSVLGRNVSATWSGSAGAGSATGTITRVDRRGRATRIEWSNGVVFRR